jgi:hypothetical protein
MNTPAQQPGADQRRKLAPMPFPPESWTLVSKDADYALAHWQQVFAVFWRRETTVEGARDLARSCAAFAATQPRGIGLLTIVESGAPLPASSARNEIADFLASGSKFIKCSAVVFEGSGFRAAAVRSVVTGLTLMAKQAYPHKVCSLEDAIAMFARILPEATGRALSADDFRASVEDVRKRFDGV